MAIGTGHRSNNYSESKRNDHLDNNRRQEQRNKGIPNKSHHNFREEHKSFSSIFVFNIPWNASVQDLWDICNKWGVLFSNLERHGWVGFHLFADVAKYGRTYNRPVERSGDGKPSVDMLGENVGFVGIRLYGSSESVKTFQRRKEIFLEFQRCVSRFIPDERCCLDRPGGSALAAWSPEDCVLTESLHREIESLIVSYRNRNYRIIAIEFAYWASNIGIDGGSIPSLSRERKDAERPSLG
ncbi:RNA-directed DNA polymerase, eukaryota, nucleotide-binding alpha-beta plait domain protein [Tanacetum coccineum]